MSLLIDSFSRLRNYCEKEQYKGWDPYDGLNSKFFKAVLPLKYSAILRLSVIQGFKRCPINLRKPFMVPKQHNAKGVGLFLQGYCNLVRAVDQNPEYEKWLGSRASLMEKVNEVAALLISLRSQGDYHGSCWGYNFDWQARRLFLFPAYTPTVVATNFCASALFDAYELTGNKEYLDIALSSAEFIINDLHRHVISEPEGDNQGSFLFSYSPLQGNDTVYNASILGSKVLSLCYKYTGNQLYKRMAAASVKAAIDGQKEDGSWVYGLLSVQNWVDSFHTGYNLDGLMAYYENCLEGDDSEEGKRLVSAIEKGFDYYIKNMFTEECVPKYYDNRMYPIDIHCPGQLFVTLHRVRKSSLYQEMEEKVLKWTVDNMQDKDGYFYYQLKQGISSKISYMRWSNAFMFNALTYFILDKAK